MVSPNSHGFDWRNTSCSSVTINIQNIQFKPLTSAFSAVVWKAMQVYNLKSDLTIYCYLICVLF